MGGLTDGTQTDPSEVAEKALEARFHGSAVGTTGLISWMALLADTKDLLGDEEAEQTLCRLVAFLLLLFNVACEYAQVDLMKKFPSFTLMGRRDRRPLILNVHTVSIAAFLLFLLSQPSGHLVARSGSVSGHVAFIKNDEVEFAFPKVPSNFPKTLHGISWMDQSGAFGFSNMPSVAPKYDLAVSDADSEFDPMSRTVWRNPLQRSWTWANSLGGYGEYAGTVGRYAHVFNEDYTFAQIYVEQSLFGLFPFRVPASILNCTMVLQTQPKRACPPRPGASKEEVSKCAKWRRETSFFGRPTQVYYIFEIVDKDGKRVQPYYDEYVRWANAKSVPSTFWARFFLGASEGAGMSDSSFHSV